MNHLEYLSRAAAGTADADEHQAALAHFQQVLQQAPRDSAALYGCCVALKALNRHGPVLSYANRLFQAGFAYKQENLPEDALTCFEKVIALGLESTQVYLQCGALLRTLERREAALVCFGKAGALTPDDINPLMISALTLQELNRHREALDFYRRAAALDPTNFPAKFNPYASHLALGEFQAGWEKFEWRWRNTHNQQLAPDFAKQLWTGQQPLDGKTIVLYAEHGQGDAIQFCRFAAAVAARGASVVLAVHPSLKQILTGVAGASLVLGQGEPVPPYDYHCPLMSLPHALGVTLETLPAALPYLRADPAKVSHWAQRLGPRRGRLRVGLVWAGEARLGDDEVAMNRRRSMPFAQLAPLFEVTGIDFFSVQKGSEAHSQLLHSPLRQQVFDYSDGFSDFAETAALLEQLDLLVAVDTGVVHLAAALGKPVWLMNRFDTCWRWMLERSDTPWYPEVLRIFRQPAAGDWDSVVAEVKQALLTLSPEASASLSRTM